MKKKRKKQKTNKIGKQDKSIFDIKILLSLLL